MFILVLGSLRYNIQSTTALPSTSVESFLEMDDLLHFLDPALALSVDASNAVRNDTLELIREKRRAVDSWKISPLGINHHQWVHHLACSSDIRINCHSQKSHSFLVIVLRNAFAMKLLVLKM
jgi:hypothetical protein